MTNPSAVGRISAWRREARGSARLTVQSEFRPSEVMCSPRPHPSAVGQDERAHVAAGALGDLGHHVVVAGLEALVGHERERHGTDELVALVAGVLAGGLGQLPGQRLGEGAEALEVGGGQIHPDVVGRDGTPVHAERPAVVEDARDPMTDLDGLEPAAEGLVEGALDQPLEPPLEPLESHAESVPSNPSCTAAPTPLPGTSRTRRTPAGVETEMFGVGECGLPCRTPGEWRNWQTRRLQVPVSERMWGFKSPLAHRSGTRRTRRLSCRGGGRRAAGGSATEPATPSPAARTSGSVGPRCRAALDRLRGAPASGRRDGRCATIRPL